jgi:LemA protein
MNEWVVLGIVIGVFLWIVIIFNRLITLRNEVKNAWHQIDVQLKRRYDLIPNLVSVVRGYMQFERDVLERVTEARTRAISAITPPAKAVAEEIFSQAIGSLFAVIENYPTLKSNENVMALQEELTTTENRIAFARQLYNDLVANYRTRLEVFPDLFIGKLFGFSPEDYFSTSQADKTLPGLSVNTRLK